MAHKWKELRYNDARDVMYDKRRKCSQCGVVQTFYKEQQWMRIVSRRWVPLVGRCKGVYSSET